MAERTGRQYAKPGDYIACVEVEPQRPHTEPGVSIIYALDSFSAAEVFDDLQPGDKMVLTLRLVPVEDFDTLIENGEG